MGEFQGKLMGEFQDMQRYIAECVGGEWYGAGEWSYNNNTIDPYHHIGLEAFLNMKSPDDVLHHEDMQYVSGSILWLVARPPFEGGLEGVAIRTHIREFARYCKEDART